MKVESSFVAKSRVACVGFVSIQLAKKPRIRHMARTDDFITTIKQHDTASYVHRLPLHVRSLTVLMNELGHSARNRSFLPRDARSASAVLLS